MPSIRVKFKNGQAFDCQNRPNRHQHHEVVDQAHSYDIVRVVKNTTGGPDQRLTVRQFPNQDVEDIRRL